MPSISISRESDTRVKADITVNAEEIRPAQEQALKRVSSRAEIKGFRKGKAPAHLVKARFAPEINLETLFVLVDRHLPEVEKKIEERVFRLLRIEDLQEKGDKMSFAVKFDLFPYVKVSKLKVAQLTRHIPAIDDTDVEQEIQNRLMRFAEFIDQPEGATAEKHDKLSVDFEIWVDDAPGGEINKDFQFELGSGALSRELEQQIISAKARAGDEFKLRKEIPAENEGKTRSYEIIATVKKISKPKLPELTDAFVAENFHGSGTVAEFRNKVREELERRFEVALIRSETEKAVKILEKHAQFFLSESFIEQKLEDFLQERKIERDTVTAPQLEKLRTVLAEREKPVLLMRQLLRDAEKYYQKKNKTDLTHQEAFRRYVHDEIRRLDGAGKSSEAVIKELDAVIDAIFAGEESQTPWKSMVLSYMTAFNDQFLFNYFDSEGIVKKGKKLTYRELAAQLAQNTPG